MELSASEFLDYIGFDLFHVIKQNFYTTIGVLIVSLSSGMFILARHKMPEYLSIIGLDYFKTRNQEIRDFVSDLIELKGVLQADFMVMYRTHNGSKFVGDNIRNIKISQISGKPRNKFPDSLDEFNYSELMHLSLNNDWKFISLRELIELNKVSDLIPIMQKNKITHLFCFRITDHNRARQGTYGFILFMWRDEPMFDTIFTSYISNWLDSLNVSFILHINSLFLEKIIRTRI